MNQSKLTTYLAVLMITAGFVLMFLSWNGAAENDFVQGQVPYLLSGGLPGLGLVLTGLTLALVQEHRRNTARLLERLDRLASEGAAAPARGPGLASVPSDGDHVVATRNTYHAAGCHVVEGRTDLTPMSVADARSRDLAACRICDPDAA